MLYQSFSEKERQHNLFLKKKDSTDHVAQRTLRLGRISTGPETEESSTQTSAQYTIEHVWSHSVSDVSGLLT